MDTGLDENETELRVLVLAVALEMLADSDGLKIIRKGSISYAKEIAHLLDQHVQILWDLWGEAYNIQSAND